MPLLLPLFVICLLTFTTASAQQQEDSLAIDTSFVDYDELFSELDLLMDSLLRPRSFTVANLAVGNGFFNYTSEKDFNSETRSKFTYSPTIGYYNRTGLGVSAGASLVHDGTAINPFQFTVTGSYDYLKNRSFLTGVSFTKYFTKTDLPFYTTPLRNEFYTYFTYRKSWLRPSVALSYGWGSREAFAEREEQIQNIQLARRGFTRITTREQIADFNLVTSIRHDFYMLDLFSKADYLRVTPQLSFVSGTQQFGFNQTSSSYVTMRRTGRNVLYNTDNLSFDNQLYFQPLSVTAFLKTEYSVGKFFIQPQMVFDYYIPTEANNFTTGFVVNTGFVF